MKFYTIPIVLLLILTSFFFFDLPPVLGVNGIHNGQPPTPECAVGDTQDCGTCGVQTCNPDGTWGECQETLKPPTTETRNWNQYRCVKKGCGKDYIEIRRCSQSRSRSCWCIGGGKWDCDPEWGDWGPTTCGPSTTIEHCDKSWQRCQRPETDPTAWLPKEYADKHYQYRPQCRCAGECLRTPENPRYYNNPTYSDIDCQAYPEKCKDPNNIRLPIKLDWDDVEGWQKEDGPKSYVINIYEGKGRGVINREGNIVPLLGRGLIVDRRVLRESEFIPQPEEEWSPCFLRSGFDYRWQVKACCNQDGTNCGEWSKPPWQFDTNLAPELKEPLDPDWAGEGYKSDKSLAATLRWCEPDFRYDVREAPQVYNLKVFKKIGDKIICHPELIVNGKCHHMTLRPPLGIYHQRHFQNAHYNFFTKFTTITKNDNVYNSVYIWKISACRRLFPCPGWPTKPEHCTPFSQMWRFQIDDTLDPPILLHPLNDPITPLSIPLGISWERPLGAKSFIYEIGNIRGKTRHDVVSLDYPQLSLNTVYRWRILPCWDLYGRECEKDAWSETRYFKTTGRPPAYFSEEPIIDGKIVIPATLKWEDVPGAKSYVFKIWGNGLDREVITEEPKMWLGFPDLRQEIQYSWKVKTCARRGGGVCGEWSPKQIFTTFKMAAPINSSPKDNAKIYTYQMPRFLHWEQVLGARYYKITIKTAEEEQIEKIIDSNSKFINFYYPGIYKWQVQACLDENCQEVGKEPSIWRFTLSAKVAPEELRRGLVPCGRKFDCPYTPWRETDPCEIRHIFLLIHIVIDFALWTLIPLILVILTLITGMMFYFSLSTGTAETLPKVKSLWKYAGYGFALIFFSWIIVTWTLGIVDFQIDLFGRWYEIPT